MSSNVGGIGWQIYHKFFMLRRWFVVLIAAGVAGCAGRSSEPVVDPVAEAMDGYVAEGRVAGVVTMVVKDGEIIHQHAAGFRDLESRDPLEIDDLFRIASQSKAVTSVATMILAEEGVLSIEDPVSRYIPEFAGATVVAASQPDSGYTKVAAETEITIRHLLTHTSGLSYGWGPAEEEFKQAGIFGWYLGHQAEPISRVAAELATLPLAVEPGSDWVYGYSTDVLGAVVEIASGQSLDEFLEERIFDPLDMHDTYFYVPEEKASRLATVYGLIDGELHRVPDGYVMESQGEYVTSDSGPHICFSGGAGLVSTAPDYIRFERMLLNEGELDGVRILSAESVRMMTTNQVGDLYDDGKRGFGFGFRIQTPDSDGPEPPGAYSWGGAYHSHYWIDPVNNMVAIVLTQLIPAAGSDIPARFKKLVYDHLSS